MAKNKNIANDKKPNVDIMWWKLPLIANTTNMIKGKWKDNMRKDIEGNHAVLTGEVNNITGLDLDFGYKLTDEELNSNPITKQFIVKFGKEPKWDTYTVRTRSGGLHYYFEYDEDLKQTQDDDCKIDIRGKGGCLYGAGTKVTKGEKQGEYKCINNKKKIKMPEELKSFLLENLYTKKPSKQTVQKKDGKIIKKKNKKMYNESYYEYSMSDDLLRRIFDGLSHDYWRCVVAEDGLPSFLTWTAACKSLDCYDIWDEYNQKFDGYNEDKNITLWNSANENYNCFQNLLKNTSFPNAEKLIDYHKYQPIIQNEIQPDITFDSQKLGYDYFKQNKNYIVKSDTGTGKTTSFQKYIERTNEKFISITSRVSLASDQYERFSEEIDNVFYYKNLTDDIKGKLLGSDPNHKCERYRFKGSVVVEIESLINRLEYAEWITNLDEMVVYLDEFNSLIQHIHTSTTLDNNLTFVLDQFIYILKNCKQIICTDADISDTSILWFKENIGRDFEFHKNEYNHNKNVKAHEILSYDTLVDKLHKTKKWLVPCDSRVNALTLKEEFPDAELIVAETIDIPNLDEHDRIIFSPKIVYGVDSTMERPVFCFFQERTIDPSQMVQMVCRCRNITNLYYLFLRKNFKPKDIDFSNLWDEMVERHSVSLKYFKNRHFQHLEKAYLNTLHRIEYDRKCYSSNPYAHFKRLIKERGFEDVDLYKNTYSASFQTDKKDLKEKTLQEKIDSFDITNEEYSKINEILNVDKENSQEFKMYFIDENLLHRHWNISTMFFQKNIEEKFEQFDCLSENFTINKITKEKTKLKLLHDMKIECDCLDPYDITPKKIFNKNLLEDYKVIFRTRTKTLKADTVYDCQKIIVGIYKKLFGDIIESKRKKIDNKCIYQYSINNKLLIQDKNLFDFRAKKYTGSIVTKDNNIIDL
jgi:hypothetical protein